MSEQLFHNCKAKTNAVEISFTRARPCCLFRTPGRPQINPKLGVDHILKSFSEYTEEKVEYGCNKCIMNEANGSESRRQYFDKIMNTEYDFYYDFQLSNLCNLACKMCSPNHSTRLEKTWQYYEDNNFEHEQILSPILPHSWDNEIVEKILEDINRRTTSGKKVIISLKGGEPTIQPELESFLENLENIHNIRVDVITNLQKLPDYFVNSLHKFEKSTIGVSCEGVEETYEYNRSLGDWNTFKQNIVTISEQAKISNKIDLQLQPLVTAQTIGDLERFIEFIKYCNSLGFKKVSKVSFNNLCYNPLEANPLKMPLDFIKEIVKDLEDLNEEITNNITKQLLNKNTYSEETFKRFLEFTRLNDEFYKTDFWQTPTGKKLKPYL